MWPWGDDSSSSYWWQRGMSTSIWNNVKKKTKCHTTEEWCLVKRFVHILQLQSVKHCTCLSVGMGVSLSMLSYLAWMSPWMWGKRRVFDHKVVCKGAVHSKACGNVLQFLCDFTKKDENTVEPYPILFFFTPQSVTVYLSPQCPAVLPKLVLEQEGEYPLWPLSTQSSSCKDMPVDKTWQRKNILWLKFHNTRFKNTFYKRRMYLCYKEVDRPWDTKTQQLCPNPEAAAFNRSRWSGLQRIICLHQRFLHAV